MLTNSHTTSLIQAFILSQTHTPTYPHTHTLTHSLKHAITHTHARAHNTIHNHIIRHTHTHANKRTYTYTQAHTHTQSYTYIHTNTIRTIFLIDYQLWSLMVIDDLWYDCGWLFDDHWWSFLVVNHLHTIFSLLSSTLVVFNLWFRGNFRHGFFRTRTLWGFVRLLYLFLFQFWM